MLKFYFSEQTVIAIHNDLVKHTGGSEGIRDKGLLSSALNAPFQSFGGQEIFPTTFEKAARLACGLIQNHAFIDGNKRIAAHIMLLFLRVNGVSLKYSQKELGDLFLGLADSKITFQELLEWIISHVNEN